MRRPATSIVAATLLLNVSLSLSQQGDVSATESAALVKTVRPERRGSGFVPIARPIRVLDTRGTQVSGNSAIVDLATALPPNDVTAVVVTLTGVSGQRSSFVTAYPYDSSQPPTSNLNLSGTAGEAVSNQAVVRVVDNRFVLTRSDAAAGLIVDVNGWFTSSSQLGVEPRSERLLDTRKGAGLRARGTQTVCLPAGVGALAASITITSVDPQAPGYVTVWPSGPLPDSSVLNHVPGVDRASGVLFTALDDAGCFRLDSTAPAHLLVDLVAVVHGGSGTFRLDLASLTPRRVWDSREWLQPVPGIHAIAGSRALRLVNLTMDATGAGYASVVADGTSAVNTRPGLAVAAQSFIPPSGTDTWTIEVAAESHLVVDTLADFVDGTASYAPMPTGRLTPLANAIVETSDGLVPNLTAVAMQPGDGLSARQVATLNRGQATMWGPDCAPAIPSTCQLMLFAHRASHGAPFLRMPDGAIGTVLTVRFVGGGVFRYRKVGQVLRPNNTLIEAINDTGLPVDATTIQCACADGGWGCEDHRYAQLWERIDTMDRVSDQQLRG
jgi:hypothetical protein